MACFTGGWQSRVMIQRSILSDFDEGWSRWTDLSVMLIKHICWCQCEIKSLKGCSGRLIKIRVTGTRFLTIKQKGDYARPKIMCLMPRLCTCRCFMMLVKTKGRTSYRGSNMIPIAPFYLCWELCVSLCIIYLIVSDPDWFNPGNRNVSNYL